MAGGEGHVSALRYLFVGGSLHGQAVTVQPRVQSLVDTALDRAPQPPEQHVHVPTGETWMFETIRVPVVNPVSQTEVGRFERDLFLLRELMGRPESHAALADAVMRVWLAGGRRVSADAPEPTPDVQPMVAYVARCTECPATDGSWVFDDIVERAKWARGHIDLTGDTVEFEETLKGGEPAPGQPG
jgi:hypothetical protein